MKKVRVMVVDNQTMSRQLFELLINESENYQLAASTNDASVAEELCGKHRAELILMDVLTHGGANGLEAAKRIRKSYPHVKIIVVTSLPEPSFLKQAKQIGVDSFWYKEVQDLPILTLMDRTMAGQSIYPDAPPPIQIGLASSREFTNRERDVLRELVEGGNNRAIAQKLGVSEHAVHYHINNMLAKTGYTNRVKLAVMVRKSGFVVNPDEEIPFK